MRNGSGKELFRRPGGTVKLSGLWLGGSPSRMTTPRGPLYSGYRYPAALIGYAVWLYFRFPLSLRRVEEMLMARGILVRCETIRHWGANTLASLDFGAQGYSSSSANRPQVPRAAA
jgi:transposase-like protein